MMKSCCSVYRPCGLGQGDCDDDSECINELVCGSEGQGKGENCGPQFLFDTAECCREPGKWYKIAKLFILLLVV